ncbi:hypothetical protein ACFQVA_03880 [Actinomadura keratinilytica]
MAAVSGAGLAGALAACGGGESGGGEEPSAGKELGLPGRSRWAAARSSPTTRWW